ncbi:MAG: hypothetical protein EXS37_03665 [Opitutus sp.]|nr:hypothetical protein [Opitutus sp.]
MADLPSRTVARSNRRKADIAAKTPKTPKAPEMSAELSAAVAAVTSHVAAPGSTAMPFITALQKEAVAVELKRRSRIRLAKRVLAAAAIVFGLHIGVTRFIYEAPSASALETHIGRLPEDVLPLFSSSRQPLQIDNVVLTQSDQIDANHFRYVASVTLRLRKALYVPAATNGTLQYRRLQEALVTAREQELRHNLFSQTEAIQTPSLPLLLQRTHQADEPIVIRVPFIARRYGWRWRLAPPLLALNLPDRKLEGDCLDRYEDVPYLIYGIPATLADIRQRTKLANEYVAEVTKAVLRRSNVEAVAETPVAKSDPTDLAQQSDDADTDENNAAAAVPPAFDPNAPAIVLPKSTKAKGGAGRGSSP